METKEVLLNLRKKFNLTQDEMAKKLFVSRQAISRWENGETIPNIDTLKTISKEFNVSINTLLGSPRKLICQSCGMPLQDDFISKELDGSMNENYCKWCYENGEFIHECTMEEMIEECIPNMHYDNENDCRNYLKNLLINLKRWK